MKEIFDKNPYFLLYDFVIEKTITLPEETYCRMLDSPFAEQADITANMHLTKWDDNDVLHCLLIKGEGRTDGYLIMRVTRDFNQLNPYVPYACYLPETSTIYYPSLGKLNQTLGEAVDFIMKNSSVQRAGEYHILSFAEVEQYTGLHLEGESFLQKTLYDMLCDRPEVAHLSIDGNSSEITFYLKDSTSQQSESTETLSDMQMGGM